MKSEVSTELSMSDKLNNQNLLRFYTPTGFKPVQAKNYDYAVKDTDTRLKTQQKELGARSTSLLSQRDGKSSLSLYTTAIPEIQEKQDKPKLTN